MGLLVSLLEYMPGISHNKNLSLENRLVVVNRRGRDRLGVWDKQMRTITFSSYKALVQLVRAMSLGTGAGTGWGRKAAFLTGLCDDGRKGQGHQRRDLVHVLQKPTEFTLLFGYAQPHREYQAASSSSLHAPNPPFLSVCSHGESCSKTIYTGT